MPERSISDVFLLVIQQQKYLVKSKPLQLVFVDLQKTFDRVSNPVSWRSMMKDLESCMRHIQRHSSVFSNEFDVQIEVH